MIGFLYPALLLAAAAAAVPIILHLIRRREIRRVIFPAIRYLRQAEQRHARRLRLRHLLLLAARVLIILLAAIAAAGPLVGRGGAEDHHPTALAIVVDESQSTAQLLGERRFLGLLVERAQLSLDLANAGDRIAVFSAVRPNDGAITTDRAGAREYLGDLQPAAALARLPEALRQAEAWLRSQPRRAREMHIFTDMQAVSLRDGAADSVEPPEAGQDISVVVYVPDYTPQPNGTAANVLPEVEPLSAGQQTSLSVTLRWFGPEPPSDPVVVRLVKGEDVVAVAEGMYGGSALLRLPPQDSGWVQGYVEAARHGLAADDRRYFTWFARPAASVAVLGDPGAFLDYALDALERGGRLKRAQPSGADVWVAIGGERLREALAAGSSVIVIPPSSPLDLPRLNSRLNQARIPWRYETERRNRGVTRIALEAPINGLSGLEVRESYRLAPSGLTAGDTSLIQLSDGEPWLVRGTTTEGTAYVLLGSPLTHNASDIPISAAMVPFTDALVGEWARHGSIEATNTNMEGVVSVRLPPRAREAVSPDGSRTVIEGGSWFRATQAGNYSVLGEQGVIVAFSVNAPLVEADLVRGRQDELEAALPAASWSWSRGADAADWQRSVFHARRGKLAWRPLVVLFVLVSIVEATLAAAGRRRAVKPAGTARNETRD
ncbi:MAG: BatA domain-containing protein [Gemmatimonadota bacterium]